MIRALLVTVFACLLSVPLELNAQTKPEFSMTLATIAPQDSPWSALLMKFKKDVEAKSNGRIEVKIRLGGVLGDEVEMVTKTKRGQVQAVGASTGALASVVPELSVVELPFLFRTPEEADYVLDNVILTDLESLFRERGLVLGFWNENGYRSFGTRDTPVKSPADLKGKKMRVQESPVHIAMYKAFGAAVTPIPTTEVPQALATGNVDGFDQSLLYMIAASWHKSIKHFSLTQHIYQPAAICFNAEWFGKLPADLQKMMIEEGRKLQASGRKAVRQLNPDLLEVLKADKIEVHTLSEAERAVFEKAVQPVYADFKKQGPAYKKLFDATTGALAKLRAGK